MIMYFHGDSERTEHRKYPYGLGLQQQTHIIPYTFTKTHYNSEKEILLLINNTKGCGKLPF